MKLAACLSTLLLAAASTAFAQGYPNKPIRLIVPYVAGGGVDVVGRSIAQELSKRLGQPVIVENKAGAGSNLGADSVAKSPPDGYTLLLASPAQAINMSLYRTLPYNTQRDLVPIGAIGAVPSILIVTPDLPVKTVADVVALAKSKPGTLNYGSGGNGTSEHLAAEMFIAMAGIKVTHVPYKGGAAAMTDVMGGQVQLMWSNLLGAMPNIKSGKLKPVALADSARSPAVPDVPTFAESGYPEFLVSVWYGIMAPAGTPREIVAQLNRELNASLAEAAMKERLDGMGGRSMPGTPEQFSAFIDAEIKRWAQAVKASGAVQD
jgi:tripartite-type tricarboxylate transporter receptor subunit TctC